jgi:hypothetical protein
MNEYWIVTDNKTGKIIANCGDINDAIMMVNFDPHNRSYSRHRFLMDQVIDITSTSQKQLPSNEIVVNMDGGVGGSWKVEESTGNGPGGLPQIKLPDRQAEPVRV